MFKVSITRSLILAGSGTVALLALSTPAALAVPSFARQTGLACEVCHTVFPELTPFGRLFKLNGYTLTGLRQIEAAGGKALKINAGAPLSVMLQTSVSNESKRAPASAPFHGGGGQNNNVEFPRQLSLFYAGEISPHMGALMQITYAQKDATSSFSWDNTDVRYANHFSVGDQDEIYGLTLNNNPSVQDVWNDTPAWGYPWIHSGEKPYDHYVGGAPGAPGSEIDNLGQAVAGLGAYTLLDNQWYAELSFYRSANQGSLIEPTTATSINGLAPYWRLAWQHQFNDSYLEIGTFGMQTKFLDGPATEEKYTDVGVDAQYELPLEANLLALHAQYLHEAQNFGNPANDGASNSSDHLNGVHVDGVMHFRHSYEVALAYDNWSGSSDASLWAWQNGTTNVSGSPDTAYWTAEAAYLPWENVKLGLQYRGYTKYVGSTTDVSNDNYLMGYGWFAW